MTCAARCQHACVCVRASGCVQGLKCLRLLNESSAVALAYGIHKSAKGEFDDSKETLVMFLDMGHSSFTSVTAVRPHRASLTAPASQATFEGVPLPSMQAHKQWVQ